MLKNDDEKQNKSGPAIALRDAVKQFTEAALEPLYKDPHDWSTRGCPTCQAISALLGFDFGCVRKAKERKK